MGGSKVPQLGEDPPYELKNLTKEKVKEWTQVVIKLFANDPKIKKTVILWGCFAPGVEDSIHSWFRQAKKTPLDFCYPGTNEAQRVKFAEDQEPAGVLKRTKFTIEFLTKLGEAFGQDTEAAVLRVVKTVTFSYDGDFGSAEAWRLLLVLNHALAGMDWRVADRALMKKAVRAHMGPRLAAQVANTSGEAENWREMLERLGASYATLDEHAELQRASKRDATGETRRARKKTKTSSGSLTEEPTWDWIWDKRAGWWTWQWRDAAWNEDEEEANGEEEEEKEEDAPPGDASTASSAVVPYTGRDEDPGPEGNGPEPYDGTGCKVCGGRHFARRCPNKKGKGKGKGGPGGKGHSGGKGKYGGGKGKYGGGKGTGKGKGK
jgi:hypothetical protein